MIDMNKTTKLYDNDAYATQFEATVLYRKETEHNGQKCYEIILDKTLFFPEEGGQTPDKGTINGMEVLDVQIKDDIITHYIKEQQPTDMLRENTTITGSIDWLHRFYNMQQHSAEHIFSGIVYKEYGYHNVGFHLSDNIVTMDFDGALTPEQIEAIEWKVNEAITKNVAIDARYPASEELAQLTYRSKLALEENVRIVTIEGYDVCACCAPHVKRTGEIGMFKVMNAQSYKGGVRISFLCGFRALLAFREKAKFLTEISNYLSTAQETSLERITQLKESNVQLKAQLNSVRQEVMLGKIKNIPAEQRDVIIIEEDLDMTIARNVVNAMMERHEGNCAVFVGTDADGYRFILGSRTNDCKEIAADMRKQFGAKGGGSKEMVQGSVESDIEKMMCYFQE